MFRLSQRVQNVASPGQIRARCCFVGFTRLETAKASRPVDLRWRGPMKWRGYCTAELAVQPGQRMARPAIKLLHEDEWLVVVDKPGGMHVHSTKEATRLEKEERRFVKDLAEEQHVAGRALNVVHRLDRPASGVLLFAKSGPAARLAQLALASPSSRKEYLVLARGSTPARFTCEEPVKDAKGIPRMALTECAKLLDLPQGRCSLLKVVIRTGRWHQIRKHLNHRAHQVIGDSQHGKGMANRYFREHYKMPMARCFLHAHQLHLPDLRPLRSRLLQELDDAGKLEEQFETALSPLPLDSRKMEPARLPGEGSSSQPSCRAGTNALTRDEGVNQGHMLLSRGFEADESEEGGPAPVTSEGCLRDWRPLQLCAPLPEDLVAVLLALPDGLTRNDLNNLSLL